MYTRNGYLMIYLPSHPRAEKGSGMVYEHIYLAESYLGRDLKKYEVVHHEDEDRSNNSAYNLFVFKSNSDHARYHKTGVKVKLEDGTYISPRLENICKSCSKLFITPLLSKSYCSNKCSGVGSRKVTRPDKEELLVLVKLKPFTEIGRAFGVSDNAVRKWCKYYGIPHRKSDIKILTDFR